MAFRIDEVLRNGKVNYIDKLTNKYDLKMAINLIRKCKFRKNIVKACENDFDNHPYFWMDIIYDMSDYWEIFLKMKEKYSYNFTLNHYENILYNTKQGESFIYNNLLEIVLFDEKIIEILFKYVMEKSNNKDFWFDFLLKNDNLHIRALVMITIIKSYPDMIKYYGDDLRPYFSNSLGNINSQISLFNEEMCGQDVSLIAYNLFLKGYNELFLQVKEFLFNNYEKNYLAYYLCEGCWIPFKEEHKKELFNDLEGYFLKDARMQFAIYINYVDKLREEVINGFENKLHILKIVDNDCLEKMKKAYFYELGKKLELYIEKYLDLSQEKIVQKVGEGTTCYALRLGDYVLKLCTTKWSKESIICPNLFLILKNLEEDYVRDQRGIVQFGLEVQPYLRRCLDDLNYLKCFENTLAELGFYVNDRLISEECGDNVRLLDNYKDADIRSFDILPDWFKKCPIVLVDRDLVYPINRLGDYSLGRKR